MQSLTVNDTEVAAQITNGKYSFIADRDVSVKGLFSAVQYAVTGKVNARNDNYEGLSVEFLKEGQAFPAIVGENGSYSISVEAGIYSIRVTHPDFEDVYRDNVVISGACVMEDIEIDSYAMGDSPVAGAKAKNNWYASAGTYISTGGSQDVLYCTEIAAREYIIQADVQYISGTGVPRVGFIVGQDADWITCVSFNLVVPDTDYLDLLRFQTNAMSVWEFTDIASSHNDCGIRGEGLTMTIMRKGNDLFVYFNGHLTRTYRDHAYLHGKGEMAVGFFCDNAKVQFSNAKFTEELSDLEGMLKAAERDIPSETRKDIDVIILGGQSNAVGYTVASQLLAKDPELYHRAKNGFENCYIKYKSDLNLSYHFEKVNQRCGTNAECFGPELGIAAYYTEHYPDRELYIIKCAWGGTRLFDQWISDSSWRQTENLYSEFIGFVDEALEQLKGLNLNPQIVSFCWMQGESDGVESVVANSYYDRLSALVNDVRARYAEYAKYEEISFVDAFINEIRSWPLADRINAQKSAHAQTCNYNFVIDTIAEQINGNSEPFGGIDHYDSLPMVKLGKLFGEKSYDVEKRQDKTVEYAKYERNQTSVDISQDIDGRFSEGSYTRYHLSDKIVVSIDVALNDVRFGSDGVSVRFGVGGNSYPVILSAGGIPITDNLDLSDFLWRMAKTEEGYHVELHVPYLVFGSGVVAESITVDVELLGNNNTFGEILGDSSVGDVKARGVWSGTENSVTSDFGRVNTLYFKNKQGTEYIIQAKLTYLGGTAIPRPGLIIAQDSDWITCFSFNLIEERGDWFGILRVDKNASVWEYDDASNQFVVGSGIRRDGLTVTVVRQGKHLQIYMGRTLVYNKDCKFLDDTTVSAAGLFTDCAMVKFENFVYEDDLSKLKELLNGSAGRNSELKTLVCGNRMEKMRESMQLLMKSGKLTVDGGWSVMDGYVPTDINGNALNLTVVCKKNEVRAFVDGIFVSNYTYQMPRFGGGAGGRGSTPSE